MLNGLFGKRTTLEITRASESLSPAHRWRKVQSVLADFPYLWQIRNEWGTIEEFRVARLQKNDLMQTLGAVPGLTEEVWLYGAIINDGCHYPGMRLLKLPSSGPTPLLRMLHDHNNFRFPWSARSVVVYRHGLNPDQTPIVHLTIYKRPKNEGIDDLVISTVTEQSNFTQLVTQKTAH